MKLTVRVLIALAATVTSLAAISTPASATPAAHPEAPITAAATPHCNMSLWITINSTRHLIVPSYNRVTRNCLMGPGSQGSQVWDLQTALRDCYGINPGPADGKYGPLTKAAVAAFQRSVGIADDGIYGPRTEDFLRYRVYDNSGTWMGWCTV